MTRFAPLKGVPSDGPFQAAMKVRKKILNVLSAVDASQECLTGDRLLLRISGAILQVLQPHRNSRMIIDSNAKPAYQIVWLSPTAATCV